MEKERKILFLGVPQIRIENTVYREKAYITLIGMHLHSLKLLRH